MTTVPLYETAQVQLDGSGNGTASVGPLSAREVWHPAQVHVQASSATREAQCIIYVGPDATRPSQRDATFTGSSGDTSDAVNADTVRCGARVWAQWTGGDANAYGTLNVTGTKEI